jgi:hypothetical protein
MENEKKEFELKSTEELETMAKTYYKGFLSYVEVCKLENPDHYDTVVKPVFDKYEKKRNEHIKEIERDIANEGTKNFIWGFILILVGGIALLSRISQFGFIALIVPWGWISIVMLFSGIYLLIRAKSQYSKK